jgi:hypothetical protein
MDNAMPQLKWGVTIGDEKEYYEFSSSFQVTKKLQELEELDDGSIAVSKTYGHKKDSWFKKVFVASHPTAFQILFIIQWHLDWGSIVFLDSNAGEYRALQQVAGDTVNRDYVPENVLVALSGGEPTPLPRNECLEKCQAFKAAFEYIGTDRRPDWLEYKHVP